MKEIIFQCVLISQFMDLTLADWFTQGLQKIFCYQVLLKLVFFLRFTALDKGNSTVARKLFYDWISSRIYGLWNHSYKTDSTKPCLCAISDPQSTLVFSLIFQAHVIFTSWIRGFKMVSFAKYSGGSRGCQGRAPTPGHPNSFIFMQFSAKTIGYHPLWELDPGTDLVHFVS